MRCAACAAAPPLVQLALLLACLPSGESKEGDRDDGASGEDEAGTCPSMPPDAPLQTLCDPKTFTALVYTPNRSSARSAPPWPLLLYLHGRGQSGDDVMKTLGLPATGSPPAELYNRRARAELSENFAMVAPQTNRGWRTSEVADFLDFVLDAGRRSPELQIDPSRVYIAGHSIGGTAALAAASSLRTRDGRHRFAACVPVAAAGRFQAYGGLRGVPVWLHHGANDVVAPVEASDEAAAILQRINGDRDIVKYSRYEQAPTAPGRSEETHGGHSSIIPAFSNPDLYLWLLKFRAPE